MITNCGNCGKELDINPEGVNYSLMKEGNDIPSPTNYPVYFCSEDHLLDYTSATTFDRPIEDSEIDFNNVLEPDRINHPDYYNSHPSGIECILIAREFPYNIGNAIAYLWRAGHKSPDPIEDIKKAVFHLNNEVERIEEQNERGKSESSS